jgi:hypothetical protein
MNHINSPVLGREVINEKKSLKLERGLEGKFHTAQEIRHDYHVVIVYHCTIRIQGGAFFLSITEYETSEFTNCLNRHKARQ